MSVKFYCDSCGDYTNVEIEPLTTDEQNYPLIWGDIVCRKCHFVIATISANEAGNYKIGKISELWESEMSKHTFETVAGDVIEIKPISILDLQLAESAAKKWCKEQGYKLEPPTYEVEALGGEIEYHPHSEITIQEIEDEKVLAEWEDYLQDTQRMKEEVQKRTAYVFLDGMVINLPKDDSWAKRRERLFGETIPTNEDDLKLYYVNNILLKTPADKQNIMLEIQKLSLTGVSEEAIQAMENLFRRRMGQRKIKSTVADIS